MKSAKAAFLCSLLPLIVSVPVVKTGTGAGFIGPLLGRRHSSTLWRKRAISPRWGLYSRLGSNRTRLLTMMDEKHQRCAADSRLQHHDFEAAKRTLMSDIQIHPSAVQHTSGGITSGSTIPIGGSELADLVDQYFLACRDAHLSGNNDVTPKFAASMIAQLLELVLHYGSGDDRYRFSVHHHAMRDLDPNDEEGGQFDFYAFACDFVRPLIDLDRSVVLGTRNVKQAFRQVEEGDNVVFFANHQSELDTPILSVLLGAIGLGNEATRVTYVAGHKVTTDPIAIPFSMGQNLICVHSKKHIMSDPSTVPAKKRQNYEALSEILSMLNDGGTVLWVAPSGGRDRRNTRTNEVFPAKFDLDVVEKYRLMGSKSKTRTHYYPLSMLTYELCPPPDFLDSGVGEKRYLRFKPVGIAIGEEVKKVTGVKSRRLFAERVENAVFSGYSMLCDALEWKGAQP